MATADGRILSQVMNLDDISSEFAKVKQLLEKTISEKDSLAVSIKDILNKIGTQKVEERKDEATTSDLPKAIAALKQAKDEQEVLMQYIKSCVSGFSRVQV